MLHATNANNLVPQAQLAGELMVPWVFMWLVKGT